MGRFAPHMLWLAGVAAIVGCGLGDEYQPGSTPTGTAGATTGGAAGATTTTTGGQGGTSNTGGTGATGAGGQGAAGGAGGCGPETTWFRAFPREVRMVQFGPNPDWLLVGHATAAPDFDYLELLDVCTGVSLATATLQSPPVSEFFPAAAGWLGDELVVVGSGHPEVATDKSLAIRHNRNTLEQLAPPTELTNDGFWAGTVGPDGALWMGVASNRGGLMRYTPGAAPLYCDVSSDAGDGRGIAATPNGLVLALHGGQNQLAFIDLSGVTPGQCPTGVNATTVLLQPPGADGRALATDGTTTFAASIVEPVDNFQAGLARYSNHAVDALFTYPQPANEHPAIDAFLGLAIDPPSTPNRTLFVTGAVDGTLDNDGLTGTALIAAVSLTFNNGTTPSPTLGSSAKLGAPIAVAPDGVYVGGVWTGGQGYIARCTRSLQCPAEF